MKTAGRMGIIPPKRRLSFAFDATRYEAIIVLANISGEMVPAK